MSENQTMEMTDNQSDRMRRYLLGELPEHEADELELSLLSDRKDLFLLAEAVEADLLVEYAEDRLTLAERERLENGLLATPGGRDRLALTRALTAKPGRVLLFWRRTVGAVTAVPARHRKAVAAAAVALVATNIALVATNPWLVQPPQPVVPVHPPGFPSQPSVPREWAQIGDTERQARSHDNLAQLPSVTPMPAPEPAPTPVVVQLVDATRSAGSALLAEIRPGNDKVEIQLPVTYEPHETFRFMVRNAANGTLVTQQEVAAGPADGEGMRIASLPLPAASLPDGNYVIEVWGLKAGEEPELIANPDLKVLRKR